MENITLIVVFVAAVIVATNALMGIISKVNGYFETRAMRRKLDKSLDKSFDEFMEALKGAEEKHGVLPVPKGVDLAKITIKKPTKKAKK